MNNLIEGIKVVASPRNIGLAAYGLVVSAVIWGPL